MEIDLSTVEHVAKALHASDRSGSWDTCANKESWRRWARSAVKAVRKADAMCADDEALKDVLRALVLAVDAQGDIDPTVGLVQAMKDAKSWLGE